MKIVKPGYEILTTFTGDELKKIESVARTCYKSEAVDILQDEKRTENFVRALIKRGHEAMLEHNTLSIKFICDRGVSHELVRHRLASFAQESTRYCNYADRRFGRELTFVEPYFWAREGGSEEEVEHRKRMLDIWKESMSVAEQCYMDLIDNGATAQEARTVLPNSIKTEVTMSANYREWRHFFKLRAARTTGKAHPQMEELTVPLLLELDEHIPVIFEDVANVVRRRKEMENDNQSRVQTAVEEEGKRTNRDV